MKLGLYGGTFDPIHRGHLEPVRAAMTQCGLEHVVYLPTARPPHKAPVQAPAWRRFTMVELALLEARDVTVSAFEMERRPAFTIDTVEHFRSVRPDDRLFLLLGADAFAGLHTWHRADELVDRVELIVLHRPDEAGAAGPGEGPREAARPQQRALDAGRVHAVAQPPIDVSSTDLRRRLAAGEPPPPGALHPRVLEYLQKYRLYQPPRAGL